jgi:AcrR family transcriptional regulator
MKAERKQHRLIDKGDIDMRRDAIMHGLNRVLRKQRQASSIRLQDVADHLGLVKGNIYYYFKNKEELIFHCHIKCVQESLAALERTKDTPGTPAERLRRLIVEHILILTEGQYGGVWLSDMDNMSPARRRHYIKLRDKFEAGVRGLIRQGIASGEFAKQDVSLAGFAMLGAINWIPKWYRPAGALGARAIAERYAALFINAFRK